MAALADSIISAPTSVALPMALRAADLSSVFPADSMSALDVRRQFAAIVEYSNDAIFSRTFDGVVTTWNAAAERIFGYPACEIIGRSSRALLPRGHRDEFRQLVSKLRRGQVVKHFETERVRKDGRRIHVSLTLSPIREASRLIGFSTIARDITEQERMREALTRRERELDDLFEEASVGLVVLSRRGRVLRANRAFLELVDCAANQVIDRSLKRFHPDAALLGRLFDLLAQRQTLHNFATQFRTRKRRTKSVLVDANALWEEGRFVHSRWFIRDISQRKRLERELIELSEREKRGFAQELHDGLGQQLGGVAYLSNVLREKLTERNAVEAKDAARIFGLVRNAIEQTRRVARGLSPIRSEPEGLMDALRELALQTKELFGIRCHLVCRQPVAVPDTLVASHLFRIAQEAVNNAMKHAKPRTISIRLQRNDHRITLRIADDGSGIGPVSPKRTGLGLRIMQYRAGLVQATLSVRPRRGRGTEVQCSAPLTLSTNGRPGI
jgi:PAS domain S-box-containing protein